MIDGIHTKLNFKVVFQILFVSLTYEVFSIHTMYSHGQYNLQLGKHLVSGKLLYLRCLLKLSPDCLYPNQFQLMHTICSMDLNSVVSLIWSINQLLSYMHDRSIDLYIVEEKGGIDINEMQQMIYSSLVCESSMLWLLVAIRNLYCL